MWKIWRLVRVANQAQACDSLVKYQQKEIQSSLALQLSLDSLAANRKKQIDLLIEESKKWKNRYDNQKDKTRAEVRRKRNWRWVSIGLIGIIVLDKTM